MSSRNATVKPSAEATEDEDLMYGHGSVSIQELDAKFPHRPHNHNQTMPFHKLYISLFDPLNDNKKKPTGPVTARAKQGPHGPANPSPHEARRIIIERFISSWRNEVGDDFYPALRLIIPEKDRDRAMYGLKEKAIGKILVKIMKIDKHSEDALLLLNWKLPGNTSASRMAGDFAGRCYEVLSKRPLRTTKGNMRIAEVNQLLDRLSAAQKEESQVPIFETFYKRMNADELMWLIRIILRQMKVGATEKTFLDVWHPQAEALFNVSSSLRRVCWELWDPEYLLEEENTGINLMECFQPQLAQFQMKSFSKMVENMRPTENDPEFWIEEKLDGERMQMHMQVDDSIPGGMRFGFWSRKAKDYTYLYGEGFEDDNSSLTRHLKGAFDENVQSLIVDGEMITWDPEADTIVGFGSLKTAALSEQRNPFQGTGHRPLYRVFDILYLNGAPLTQYILRDRRKALERVIHNVHRRLEVHEYKTATKAEEIDPMLHAVVAEASEGLVLKNPRSIYRLNSRNDDWMKVKPEYMEEFGESLDCIVIGGYYGSGHRGGRLSSFLCGLRVDENHKKADADPQKCFSFFKVGGGFKADDYANIRHHTEGKWRDWDSAKPPTKYIELGGGVKYQYEKPDVWIMPEDSVVLSVKAASVGESAQFKMGFTLRFPRFKSLRMDRDWKSALSIQDFKELKEKVEMEVKEKEFKVDERRRPAKRTKKNTTIAGNEVSTVAYSGSKTGVFDGLNFCIMSEATQPVKKTKGQLENIVKSNGGKIYQSPSAAEGMICIADKKVVKVASLVKSGSTNVVRTKWLLDAVQQAEADAERGVQETFLIPFEPTHMFHLLEQDADGVNSAVDDYGDSYARDAQLAELQGIVDKMTLGEEDTAGFDAASFLHALEEQGEATDEMKLWLFNGFRIWLEDAADHDHHHLDAAQRLKLVLARNVLELAGATIVEELDDLSVTHAVVAEGSSGLTELRKSLVAKRKRMPRIVSTEWALGSFEEGTLLDEERYTPK